MDYSLSTEEHNKRFNQSSLGTKNKNMWPTVNKLRTEEEQGYGLRLVPEPIEAPVAPLPVPRPLPPGPPRPRAGVSPFRLSRPRPSPPAEPSLSSPFLSESVSEGLYCSDFIPFESRTQHQMNTNCRNNMGYINVSLVHSLSQSSMINFSPQRADEGVTVSRGRVGAPATTAPGSIGAVCSLGRATLSCGIAPVAGSPRCRPAAHTHVPELLLNPQPVQPQLLHFLPAAKVRVRVTFYPQTHRPGKQTTRRLTLRYEMWYSSRTCMFPMFSFVPTKVKGTIPCIQKHKINSIIDKFVLFVY